MTHLNAEAEAMRRCREVGGSVAEHLEDIAAERKQLTDPAEGLRFLQCLDRNGAGFTFQTFDDDSERKSKALVRIFNGSFAEHEAALTELSAKGAGIFVTVNETNLKGRKATDITRVRSVFVDLDWRAIEPVLNDSDYHPAHRH